MISPDFNRLIETQEVGVLLLGYNRPELLEKRILELSQTDVEDIYISIDGGPESHTNEMTRVKKIARKLLKNHRLNLVHHKNNLGMVHHITGEISRVLSLHKYIIVIEDDIVVSDNFFKNLVNGLDCLNKLNTGGIVSGYSPLFNSKIKNKWRKTHITFFWGWACSRETWKVYNFDIQKYLIASKLSDSKTWKNLNSFQRKFWLAKIMHSQKFPLFTWDFQFMFFSFVNNFVHLTPIFSIVGNEGFNDPRAVHTKGKKPSYIKNSQVNNSLINSISRFSRLYSFFDFDNYFVAFIFKIKRFIKYN